MGTYYTNGASKQDIIDELLEPLKEKGHLVDHHVCRETGEWVLWTVEKGERDGEEYQFIGCYLLRADPSGWGYKPMDETMGPYYESVPKHWLKAYPCKMISQYAHMLQSSNEWRQRVAHADMEPRDIDPRTGY